LTKRKIVMTADQWHEENRESWNAATIRHNSHKGDQAAFLRSGGSTLYPEEIDLLGDVEGKRLVHLQCNSGQDTLSIASQLGALVTGVDISDEAIRFARGLSAESGIPATFVRSDIYHWFDTNREHFDVAFASYGAIIWLSDLSRWAAGISSAVRPGGRLALVEFHPIMGLLDGVLWEDLSEASDCIGGRHYRFDVGVGDYVAEAGSGLTHSGEEIAPSTPYENPFPSHEFAWGVGDVLSALLDAGMVISGFKEYPYSNGFKPYPQMEQMEGRRMVLPDPFPKVPLMYSVTAEKPAAQGATA
jgi:SAM-dependent methyltransferase